ncbi:MAG: hypothetical protein FWC89_01805 [Defluviitaleaceae bacterium]|nr:hypothetical protein [Defluviitaleaceae bacterium]
MEYYQTNPCLRLPWYKRQWYARFDYYFETEYFRYINGEEILITEECFREFFTRYGGRRVELQWNYILR